MNWDRITCRGLYFDCEIGFFPSEQKVRQKVEVKFTAWILPMEKKENLSAIRLDYFRANQAIAALLDKKPFKLVETASDEIAALLLKKFDIGAVSVSLTKHPLDMPGSTVTYKCYRAKHEDLLQHRHHG